MATSLVAVVAIVVIAAVSVEVSMAQSVPSCAGQLLSCYSYLNATARPPNDCCDRIEKAVATELKCLCNLYENPSFLNQFQINVTEALNLSKICGVPASISLCDAAATSPTSSASLPPPGSTPGNGIDKIASSGMLSLLSVWICFVLFH